MHYGAFNLDPTDGAPSTGSDGHTQTHAYDSRRQYTTKLSILSTAYVPRKGIGSYYSEPYGGGGRTIEQLVRGK